MEEEPTESRLSGKMVPIGLGHHVQNFHLEVLGEDIAAELQALMHKHDQGEVWFGHQVDELEHKVRGRLYWSAGEREDNLPTRYLLQGIYLDYVATRCKILHAQGLRPDPGSGMKVIRNLPQAKLSLNRAA